VRKLLVIITAILLSSTAVYAQVELTPSVGWRWGGTVEYDETDIFSTDVNIDESMSYGATLGLPLTRNLLFELSVSRQSSEFETDDGLFDEEVPLADVDVTYYQAGLSYEFDARYARPYIGFSLGGATLNPDIQGISSENRFAGTLGGGLKVDLAPHLGLKLDARGYWIMLDDNDDWDDDDWGCDDGCYNYDEGDNLNQGEVSLGLVFWF
jgi:hypothetical protein